MRSVRTSLSLVLFSLAALVGCGMSDEEATTVCNEELEARALIAQDGDLKKCVDCYKQCGSHCEVIPNTPLEFVCPS